MRTKTALAILAGSAGASLVSRLLVTDRTLALLSKGYTFIPERCRRHGTDVFETRIMLTEVVCMTGEEATRVFYEPGRFTQVGPCPRRRSGCCRT